MNVNLKSPAVQRGVLGALACMGLLGVFFVSHVLPFNYRVQKEKIQTLKDDYEKKSTELARARATVADLPRFEAECENLHSQWAQAAELVPTEHQMPVLLRRIALFAQQNGVGLSMVRPGGAHDEQHYTEVPMQLSVNGPYHQIGSFLADLANMPRIVTVTDLSLKANKDDPGSTTLAEFTASSYHLTSGSASDIPVPAQPAVRAKEEQHDRKKS